MVPAKLKGQQVKDHSMKKIKAQYELICQKKDGKSLKALTRSTVNGDNSNMV